MANGKWRTIPDLPSIPRDLGDFLVLQHVSLRFPGDGYVFSPLRLEFVEELCPYRCTVLVREVLISNDHVDTGDESIVEVTDSVRCQEQDTSVVLHRSEKDFHRVSFVILLRYTSASYWRQDCFSRGRMLLFSQGICQPRR